MMWKVVILILAAVFTVGADRFVGGLTDANINDPEIQKALNFAVAQYNKDSKGMYLTQVAKVIKVQQQLVAGMNYFFTVEMARTPCKKDGTEQNCKIYTDPSLAQPFQCSFEVWSRSWLNIMELVDTKCMK